MWGARTDREALVAAVAAAKPTEGALVIVGQGALNEADGGAVLSQAMALTTALGGHMLVLHTAASRVGAQLVLADVRLMPGALDLAARGVCIGGVGSWQ